MSCRARTINPRTPYKMFAPEELIVLTDYQMYNHEQFRPHLEIQIPGVPDFGDFEEMPREPPVLKKSLSDLGEEDQQDASSVASTDSNPEEESQFQFAQSSPSTPTEEVQPDHVIINIYGYNYKIITTGLTQEEIDQQILSVESDALDYMLDSGDVRFM